MARNFAPQSLQIRRRALYLRQRTQVKMKVRAVILAGGEGSRLGVLTAKRTKPAVPFAGKYRIIDFALSNCVNSGLYDIMVLAQYRPHSLLEHIGAGRPWDLDRSLGPGVQVFQPYLARRAGGWYRGTADAVQQNFSFLKRGNPELVLLLSGDHIYRMDFDPMITFHQEQQADLTIATLRVPTQDARRFGILQVEDDYRVTGFEEKPRRPKGSVASMGIYIFRLAVLDRVLRSDLRRRGSSHDFGKDIIPRMIADGARIVAFPYSGYWKDVGTVHTYWQAHMDLLSTPPALDLNDRTWVIHTKSEERPPVRVATGAQVRDSLVTDGSVIDAGAVVERSVLSPGVRVGANAIVRDAVILTDANIGAGARVENAIIDKNVRVEAGARVGSCTPRGAAITMVGKDSIVPARARVGAGCVIGQDVRAEDYATLILPAGSQLSR